MAFGFILPRGFTKFAVKMINSNFDQRSKNDYEVSSCSHLIDSNTLKEITSQTD